MIRPFVRLAVLTTLLLAPSMLTTQALAQPTTDSRDYEGAVFAPNGTWSITTYLRHVTTTQKRNLTSNQTVFRAGYLIKFGNLAIAPFDILVPVVDADLKLYYSPNADPTKPPTASARPTATSGPVAGSIRQTGIADCSFLPSLIYSITQNAANYTHTYMGAGLYTTLPIGNYASGNAPLNLGENRWTIKPQVMIGQRFATIFTTEIVANMLFYTDNQNYHAATALPVGTLSQKNSFNAEAHLGMDVHETMYVSASYYLQELGQKTYTPPTSLPAATRAAIIKGYGVAAEKATVQTLRLSWGIRIEKQSLLLLQYQADLKTGGEESNTRTAIVRFSHWWW